jgi:hypothetical protein
MRSESELTQMAPTGLRTSVIEDRIPPSCLQPQSKQRFDRTMTSPEVMNPFPNTEVHRQHKLVEVCRPHRRSKRCIKINSLYKLHPYVTH